MDSLFFLSRAQFHQLCTHIALYREDASPGYKALAVQSLAECYLNPSRYTIWNVPNMSGFLGKAIPLDIHHRHVLVDEVKALAEAKSYGVLRYAYLSAAVRAKQGGRWRYDFATMNIALLVGVFSGAGFMHVGRRRWGWMRRRPVGSIAAGMITCVATTMLVRQAVRLLGVGVVMAEKSHRLALGKLDCVDCLDDVHAYTAAQIVELRKQKVPVQPGMPAPPPEMVARFEKGVTIQVKVLEADMSEVKRMKKHLHGSRCAVHHGLCSDADGYVHPQGLPILPEDRLRAKTRDVSASASANE